MEPYNIYGKFITNSGITTKPMLLGSSIGKLDIFSSMLKLEGSFNRAYTDDSKSPNIYLTSISNTNANNNSFYGEIVLKLCKCIPDGIICYFSSVSLMEYFIKKWNEQGVFDTLMNNKLLFIEEQDSIRLSNVLVNYKKACDIGRGGLLFLSTRNKAALCDIFTDHQSRCIIFIGFPIETKLTKKFEYKLENIKKQFKIESKEYFNYDTFKLFAMKVGEKVSDMFDKKVLVVLDEKLMSEKLGEYLPAWLRKIMHDDYDKENVNTDERLKNVKLFLENKNN
jgi:DNA excision repair protein ERCC-2